VAQTSAGDVAGRVAPLRPLGSPRRAFALALPARAELRALVFPGTRYPKSRLRLPAGAEQCGYSDIGLLAGRLDR